MGGMLTGCEVTKEFTISDIPEQHLITGADIVANDDCNPLNGRATITDAQITTGDVADYTFTWYESDAMALLGTRTPAIFPNGVGMSNATTGSNIADSLSAGTYYVSALHDMIDGCETPFFEVIVDDERTIPIVRVTNVMADTSCDNATTTGTAEVNVIETPLRPAEYNFTWYSDAALTTMIPNANVVGADNGDPGANRATMLQDGTYYVVARDNTNSLGCENDPATVVTIDPFVPVYSVGPIAATDYNITPIDDCDPTNGGYEILRVTETTVGGGTSNTTPLAEFNFTWYSDAALTTMIPNVNVVGADNGDAGAAEVSDLDVGTYYVDIKSNTTGCPTTGNQVHTFTLDDVRGTISITKDNANSSEDTFCDNTDFTGSGRLGIQITEDGTPATLADYSVEWYRGAMTTAPGTGDDNFLANEGTAPGTSSGNANAGSAIVDMNILTLNTLSTGDYSVFITKNAGPSPNSGCTTSAVLAVNRMSVVPTINVDDIQARTSPDSLCMGMMRSNSGTLTIGNDDFSTGDMTDFNIEIRQSSATGTHLARSPYLRPTVNTISYPNLEADDYFIIAEHANTGCIAATAIIHIESIERNPQIGLVNMAPDQNCGTSAQVGGMEIDIDGRFDHTDHFTVQWVDVASGDNVAVAYPGVTDNETVLSGVPAGDYRIDVTNTNTNCSSNFTYTIPDVAINPSISKHMIVHQTICSPDMGSFELNEALFDGSSLDQAQLAADGFALEIYPGADPLIYAPLVDGNIATPYIFEDIGIGTYYAFVRKTASECISGGLEFTIEDERSHPSISITLQEADSTCMPGAAPNGTLSALADGVTDADPNYDFQWYQGSETDHTAGTATILTEGGDASGNGSTSVGVATANISGLSADVYTIEVTNTATNCVSVDEFIIPNTPAFVSILRADTVPSTVCSGNGSITVLQVNRGDLTDYTFEYYDENPLLASPAPVFTGTGGGAYMDVAAGTYYIVGTNTLLGCETTPYQAIVTDDVIFPRISTDDDESNNVNNCDPSNPDGMYSILVDGAMPDPANYDIQWYFGTGTDNPLDDMDIGGNGTLSGETTATVSGLPASSYTVEVREIATGCTATETYVIQEDTRNDFGISISSVSNTNCGTTKNGKLTVRTLDNRVADYDYYWFFGSVLSPDITAADISETTTIGDLEALSYTVVVVEKADRYCTSVEIVTVDDDLVQPDFLLNIVSHQTLCFTSHSDGFAQVTDYDRDKTTIEWRDDAGTIIGISDFVDSLFAGSYSIRLTDVITGCEANENFTILNEAEIPANPTIIVNSNRTNCAEPNGHAIANVTGLQDNFLFEWFDPKNPSEPYATDAEVFNLDSITYLVRATNLATGCASVETSVDIRYEITDPKFEVIIDHSVCLRTEDGSANQFTGTAFVAFSEFIEVQSYSWKDESGVEVSTDARLIDAYPGTWTVTFVAQNGCEYSASFIVGTAVRVYNGVSANGDSKNDFLLIDCIDYFPNNNVQIFNRAGVKIYEADRYDNTNVRFEGTSNVGGGGLKLPEGTYFFVIEKRTGEQPIQGYLELVR